MRVNHKISYPSPRGRRNRKGSPVYTRNTTPLALLLFHVNTCRNSRSKFSHCCRVDVHRVPVFTANTIAIINSWSHYHDYVYA